MRNVPSLSQRRPEVTTRWRRHAGRPAVRSSAFDKATSSINGRGGKPPTSSNALRETKIAWSPVAMPVMRERRFISDATAGSSLERPSIVTSKRPQWWPCRTASCIAVSASLGSRESACRKRNISASLAARAPAFICNARPGEASHTRIVGYRATTPRLESLLPPSTAITWTASNASIARNNAASVCGNAAASFKNGMTTATFTGVPSRLPAHGSSARSLEPARALRAAEDSR